ncbi:MAG: OmpA family protein [Candidatus Omnitrophica bacterium]|nr:OmpA family protein [Candidatus Omnitrophota bacterium]
MSSTRQLKKISRVGVSMAALLFLISSAFALNQESREESRSKDMQKLQEKFSWWGTSDAQPAPVRDTERGGYWWMPKNPGPKSPTKWGNGGYVYVYKIIFDYREEELPAPKAKEMRPSLLIKRIIKNVKVYFDYDKAEIRDDAARILTDAADLLKRNDESSILISGNCDARGTEKYNEKLGRKRGQSVKSYMLDRGVADERIKIISRGKLDALAPVTDLEGMQKDRNAQFMVAEVEEVMMPYPDVIQESGAKPIEDGTFMVEQEESIESEAKVSTKVYVTKKGDTLWKIAEDVYGNGRKWNNIYRFNKDKISNPNRLKPGVRLTIPIE